MPAFLWYGMGGREEKKENKENMWGENEEELGGIGLFGLFARISKCKEKAQPARQYTRNSKICDEMMSKVGTAFLWMPLNASTEN